MFKFTLELFSQLCSDSSKLVDVDLPSVFSPYSRKNRVKSFSKVSYAVLLSKFGAPFEELFQSNILDICCQDVFYIFFVVLTMEFNFAIHVIF